MITLAAIWLGMLFWALLCDQLGRIHEDPE